MTNSFAYKGLLVREVEPDDYAAVLDIAGCCFRYSRFHLDAVFPAAVAHAIKRAWIQSYVDRQRGEQLLVALVNGKPAGFLAVLEATVEGQACRVIDLIGVAQTYQGRGVGRALVGCFLEDCAHRGLGARVGTQAANIPSLRLYESLGFRVCETAYVLHAHVGGGGEGVRR
jgi:ribosomal protein S18 acetylase RimI-like enzyme